MRAAYKGNIRIVTLLLDQAADMHATNREGSTALEFAAFKNHPSVVELLLNRGADINAADAYGDTPLIKSAAMGHASVVRFLVKKGADVNARNRRGNTALLRAASNGHLEVVKVLLASNADIRVKNLYGLDAMSKASLKGHHGIARVSRAVGADTLSMDQEATTSLTQTGSIQHAEFLKLLSEAGGKAAEHWEAIVATLRAADPDLLESLVTHGGDIIADGNLRDLMLVLAAEAVRHTW